MVYNQTLYTDDDEKVGRGRLDNRYPFFNAFWPSHSTGQCHSSRMTGSKGFRRKSASRLPVWPKSRSNESREKKIKENRHVLWRRRKAGCHLGKCPFWFDLLPEHLFLVSIYVHLSPSMCWWSTNKESVRHSALYPPPRSKATPEAKKTSVFYMRKSI